jgi:hypothetical protein
MKIINLNKICLEIFEFENEEDDEFNLVENVLIEPVNQHDINNHELNENNCLSYNIEEITFEKAESELQEIMNELEDQEAESVCNNFSTSLNESESEENNDQSEDDEENQRNDQIAEITIQSETVPRFSCANHKLNLAVRSAVKNQPFVKQQLKKLNDFAVKIRKTIKISSYFKNAKARLRTENNTRWGSSFLVLEVFLKAYNRDVFQSNNLELPVKIEKIKIYFKILKILYKCNLHFQSNKSSIADVVPLITGALASLDKLSKEYAKIYVTGMQFCNLLIQQLKIKFSYELSSKVYKVILFK